MTKITKLSLPSDPRCTRARWGVDRLEDSCNSPSGWSRGRKVPTAEGRERKDWLASEYMTPYRAKRGGR